MPALLLLPFVAIFGGSIRLARDRARRDRGRRGLRTGRTLGVDPVRNAWVCAFLLAGTDLLWWRCSATCGSSPTSARSALRCSRCRVVGTKRGWLVALWAGCAILSRFDFVARVTGVRVSARDREARSRVRQRCLCPDCADLGWLQLRALGHVVRHRLHGVVSPGSSRHADRLAVSLELFPLRIVVVLRSDTAACRELSVPCTDDQRCRADLDVARARAGILRAQTGALGCCALGCHAVMRGPEFRLLRQRIRAVRHASRAGLRAISRGADLPWRERAHTPVGHGADGVLDGCGFVGCLVLECFVRTN